MKAEDFDMLRDLLKECSGLALADGKRYLLESRLMPVARRRDMAGLEDLIQALRTKRDAGLVLEVTEAMTTNESYFFRDGNPFEQLRKDVLPRLLESRNGTKRLRIWCAACSTGQEPYSIAIILKEDAAKFRDWRVEILATDFSRDVLEKARVGMYSQFEVQRGLPIQYLMKYFEKVNETWRIDSSVRAMVRFDQLNLLKDFSRLGVFDVIFCRNVLIYFDNETKARVLDGIRRILPADGVLCLGGAETALGIAPFFSPIKGLRGAYGLVH